MFIFIFKLHDELGPHFIPIAMLVRVWWALGAPTQSVLVLTLFQNHQVHCNRYDEGYGGHHQSMWPVMAGCFSYQLCYQRPPVPNGRYTIGQYGECLLSQKWIWSSRRLKNLSHSFEKHLKWMWHLKYFCETDMWTIQHLSSDHWGWSEGMLIAAHYMHLRGVVFQG